MAILLHKDVAERPKGDKSARGGRRKRYPSSLAQFVSICLGGLLLLLVAALVVAGVYLERATTHGQKAVSFATRAVQYSIAISDLTKDMERSARVYQVLGNDSLLASYNQFRLQLDETSQRLTALDIPESLRTDIEKMRVLEKHAFATISTAQPGSEAATSAIVAFASLLDALPWARILSARARSSQQDPESMRR